MSTSFNRRARLPSACIAWTVGLLVLAACGGGPTTGHTAQARTTHSASTADSLSSRSGLVDIGGGRLVYAECAGTGSPTVLLESGDESDIFQWRLVYPNLARHARTCRYDRLGNGQSNTPTGCRELTDLRADLENLLRALGESGPYELVGTSGGGYLMAGFAYAHPQSVVGMVLVETPHAIVRQQAPPELLAELRCDSPRNQERRDYVRVENDAWSQRHRIGLIPMTVITNDYGDNYQNEEQRTNVAGQKGWLVLSPQSRQVVVTSGHDVPENEPELVIKEILRVRDAASGG